MKRFFCFFAMMICLSSCEQETYVEYIIENNSTSTIFLSGNDIIHVAPIEEEIQKGENKTIIVLDFLGKSTELIDPITIFGNDLLITNSFGDTLQKKNRIIDNWNPQVNENKGSVFHICMFNISDEGF